MASVHFAEVAFDLMLVFMSLVCMEYLPPGTALCFIGFPSLLLLGDFLTCLQS